MADSSTIGAIVLALLGAGIFACVGLAIVAWRRRETPGARSFLGFLGAAVFYSVATLGILLAPTDRVAVAFYYLASVGGVAVGVAWVVFVVEYAGYWDRLAWWGHLLLWGQPALYVLALLTNPIHGAVVHAEATSYGWLTLVAPTFTPLAMVEIVYLIVLVLWSFAVLGNLFLRTRNVHRKQTGAILAGSVLPVTAYGLFWTGFAPHPAMDLTPMAFVLQAVVVGWALFRYDFLSVSPIATELYIQQMADPLLVLDERDRLVDYNDSAAVTLGIDGTRKRPHLRSVSPELAAALDDDTGTLEYTTSDGPATFDLTETVIRDRHDRQRGSMVVLRDVTELEEQRAELQRKNAQLEQFTSVVSHDLRNPLNVAKGFAELARDEEDFDALDRSIAAMESMEELVEDLLTLARKGQTVDDVQLVSFLEVVEAAWTDAATDGATLEVEDDADFECYADPDRFRELLGNLFRNAVEHGPDADDGDDDAVGSAGEPALTVTVGRLHDRSGFYVEDDGVGIAESDADEVFASGYSTTDGGTGLGLSIVSSIATGHGWTVSLAESDAGGARFEFGNVSVAGSE